MNIVHYTDSLNEGGIASFLTNLVTVQSKTQQVGVCTIFKNNFIPDDIKNSSVAVVSLNKPGNIWSYFIYPFIIFKEIKQNDANVIHIHISFAYYILAIILLRKKRRFFYTIHSDAFKERHSTKIESIIWPLKRLFFKKKWIIPITISPQSEESFYNAYGFHAKMICNGITLKSVHPSIDMQKYRRTAKTKIFVHAGRISGAKNQIAMCQAFAKAISAGLDGHLVIAGAIQDEGIFSTIKEFLNDRISYIGSRSDILSIFKGADFMLLPSIWEGMPISLLEAMSQGCIPICTPVGGIPSIIEHMNNGILISDSSEDAICQTLKNIIHLSAEEESQLSEKAMQSVKNYSIEKTAQEYNDFYSSFK